MGGREGTRCSAEVEEAETRIHARMPTARPLAFHIHQIHETPHTHTLLLATAP
jgi:hypothetical protein